MGCFFCENFHRTFKLSPYFSAKAVPSTPSRSPRILSASRLHVPHTNVSAVKPAHTLGRSDDVNIPHRPSEVRCMHGVPPGLPFSMPGMREDIDGAIQHAPHPARHSKKLLCCLSLFIVALVFFRVINCIEKSCHSRLIYVDALCLVDVLY